MIRLKPVIASYSGVAYTAISHYLTDDVINIVAGVAEAPKPCEDIPASILAELTEMHVLREQDGIVMLNTAVFLRDDIAAVLQAVQPPADRLAEHVTASGAPFLEAPPELTLFLAGIIGLVQGLGAALRQRDDGPDWRTYPGKYARSKVDFDQPCDLADALGPDVLNKSVYQGERFTAVFIGPGGVTFPTLLPRPEAPDLARAYTGDLNRYLVDAYAELVVGEREHPSLRAAAEAAGLYREDRLRSIVVTAASIRPYEAAIRAIADSAATTYAADLGALEAMLRATTAGHQGVPTGSMTMHLWRYVRRIVARALYDCGFLRDDVRESGTLTVFYENDVELIRELLI